jgi:hypothetical protein
MLRVFISYRRDDAKWQAREIYRSLVQVLPRDHVFMDIDSIPPGADYVEFLEGWVEQCDIMLVLIGPGWVDASDPETGRRRLENPNDFVRIEVRKGLERGIPIVPVLLDGAAMPEVSQVPGDLRQLLRRNAEFIEHRTADADVERLIRKLGLGRRDEQAIGRTEKTAYGPVNYKELRLQFQEALMEALGLPAKTGLRRIKDPRVAVLALAAAYALKLRAPSHHGLNEQLKLMDSENRRALEAAQEALRSHFAHDAHALDLLDEAMADIDRLLPALILLPEGGLLVRLVTALEEAHSKGALSGDEDLLLKRLRRLTSDLDAMDWSNGRAWKGVQYQIEHINEAGKPTSPRRKSVRKLS